MKEKWSFKYKPHNGVTLFFQDGTFMFESFPGMTTTMAQQICDALNDARPWRTGVPEKEGRYQVTYSGYWGNEYLKIDQLTYFANEWVNPNGEVIAYRPLPEPYDPNKK